MENAIMIIRIELSRQQYKVLRKMDPLVVGGWSRAKNAIEVVYGRVTKDGRPIGSDFNTIYEKISRYHDSIESLPYGSRKPHEVLVSRNLFRKFSIADSSIRNPLPNDITTGEFRVGLIPTGPDEIADPQPWMM